MRIGIDASRAFTDQPTGTERYSYELITRILRLKEARKQEWILYIRPNLKFEIRNLKLNLNCKFQIVNFPFLWTQVGLAYRTWVDRLDVLWIPAHTLPLLRKPRVKTVVTIHGIEYEWLPAYENVIQRWYLPLSTQYAVRSADKIIAVSEFTKKQLIERLGADEGKIKVVYEGYTPLSDLPPNLGGRRQRGVLKKYGLISQQYLLFIGTIQPRKNLVRLIEAFADLMPKNLITPSVSPPESGGERKRGVLGGIKLVIAGKPGWSYEEVLAAPKKFGVEKSVIFTGYVNDAERDILLQNALVYVQPSIIEGFGLPVLEAMAAGVPVVSSTGGALAEVVGNAGRLFSPNNINEITKCLQQTLEDGGLRQELVRRGRQRAANFSWDTAVIETYKILTTWS
jgi:glycosyltransferase involved in cell wall biosynthesis